MTQHPETEAVVTAIHAAAGRTTAAVAGLHGALVNDTLTTETVVIPAAGMIVRSWSVPYGTITVANPSGAAVTVAGGPAGDPARPPVAGVGVFTVGAARWATLPVAEHSLAIYGAAGTALVLSVSARPLPPAFGVCA